MTKRVSNETVVRLAAEGLTNDDLCARLGVTTRTLTRWRVADLSLTAAINAERARIAAERKQVTQAHGTTRRYKLGCRCRPCTSANTERTRTWVRSHQGQQPPAGAHGKASTYQSYGCRCRPCTEAHSAYCRPYSDAWRARQRGEAPDLPPRPRAVDTSSLVSSEIAAATTPLSVRVEQRIAAGSPSSQIMAALDVNYETVRRVRDAMDAEVAS